MGTVLHNEVKLCELQEQEEVLEARISALEKELQAAKQLQSPSLGMADELELEADDIDAEPHPQKACPVVL